MRTTNFKMQEINVWESELEEQMSGIETELEATSSYLESFESILKDNVEKDSSYCQSSS